MLIVVLTTVDTGFVETFDPIVLLAGGGSADADADAAVVAAATGVAVLVTACIGATGFSTTFEGGTDRALLLTFGSICRISTSGSLTSAPIKREACLVASVEPLIVIMRSFWDFPCFSTSMCAPVAARIAFILLPARPMTRDIAYVGMIIFLTDVSEVGCCCVELLRLTSFQPSSRLNACGAFDLAAAVLLALSC